MDKLLNIKRPYFKKRGYNQVIDNSFNILKPAQTSESVSDFFQRFQDLLLFLSDEQLSQFFRGSLPFARSFKGSFSDEVDRLNDLTGSLKEEEENRKLGSRLDEHPIIPNGSFLRKDNNGTTEYYYIQRGLLRKIDKKSTFEALFQSITGLDPIKTDNLNNYAPFVPSTESPSNQFVNINIPGISFPFNGDIFISSFPRGKTITGESLGEETNETDISFNGEDISGFEDGDEDRDINRDEDINRGENRDESEDGDEDGDGDEDINRGGGEIENEDGINDRNNNRFAF